MTPPRSLPLVALVLAAAVVVVEAPIVVGVSTWSDVRYHVEIAPPRLAAATAVQAGDLPAWWDGVALGEPLLARPAHGALYPPIWLAATPRALDGVLVLHVCWLALGVAAWARRRGRARAGASELAAVTAGVLVAATGAVASAALRGALPGLAQLPWLGLAASALADAATRHARARAALAIAAVVAAIALAGEPALVVDAVVLAVALAARRGAVRWLVAAVAVGLAIGALQWWPAIVAGEAGFDAGAASRLGRLAELVVATPPDASGWPSLHVGAALLALAIVSARKERVVVAMVGCALLVAAPIAGAREVHLAALAVIAAVLAARGVDAMLAGERRALVALGAGAAIAAVLAVVAADRGALVDGAFALACIGAAIAIAGWRKARLLPLALVLVIAPNVIALRTVAPLADRAIVDDEPAWARAAQRAAVPRRLLRPVLARRGAVDTLADAIATLAGASAARHGIAVIDRARPLPGDRDRAWLAAASQGDAALDRFGVALAILPAQMDPRFVELGRRGSWALVELPVAPAAAVVTGWREVADASAALAALFPTARGPGLRRGQIVLYGDGAGRDGAAEPTACTIARWRAGELALDCRAAADGYAVVSSTAAPGWAAELDGASVPWRTADVVRRAIAIPAGAHHVRWRYVTPGLALGGGCALVGVAGLAALALLTRARRRDRAAPATTTPRPSRSATPS